VKRGRSGTIILKKGGEGKGHMKDFNVGFQSAVEKKRIRLTKRESGVPVNNLWAKKKGVLLGKGGPGGTGIGGDSRAKRLPPSKKREKGVLEGRKRTLGKSTFLIPQRSPQAEETEKKKKGNRCGGKVAGSERTKEKIEGMKEIKSGRTRLRRYVLRSALRKQQSQGRVKRSTKRPKIGWYIARPRKAKQ